MMAGPEPVCIAVAYSGGRDSTALLHATAVAARDWPGTTVLALHVPHGLTGCDTPRRCANRGPLRACRFAC